MRFQPEKAIQQLQAIYAHPEDTRHPVLYNGTMIQAHLAHHHLREAAARAQLVAQQTEEMDARTQETAATLAAVTRLHEIAKASGFRGLSPADTTANREVAYFPVETATRPAAPPKPATTEYSVLMTTLGMGIDPFFGATASSSNATVAAVKAVRDAMDRGILRFPSDPTNLFLHIQLGVPPRTTGSPEPMHVDLGHLTSLLPSFVPLLPVDIIVGGLLVRDSNQSSSAVCAAVVCITLQRAVIPKEQPPAASFAAIAAAVVAPQPSTIPVGSPASVGQHVHNGPQPQAIMPTAAVPAASGPNGLSKSSASDDAAASTSSVASPSAQPVKRARILQHSNSMDVLAQVSAEIHDKSSPPMTGLTGEHDLNGPATAALDGTGPNNYNYKKLPPGRTTKNNTRLFVQHNYKDYSNEAPYPDEFDLLDANPTERTTNAAFPIKLHETLSLIERDGYKHIVGWLPHGRSFKIHQQKQFVEMILPKYFVMTKKSSFLRQLNLYGFNRLSGVGPDQGSYYHEKFLRGMRFLCRRIHRQKVNGNGIRAAGNPDGEPNFSHYPSCPSGRSVHSGSFVSHMMLPKNATMNSSDSDKPSLYNTGGDHSSPRLVTLATNAFAVFGSSASSPTGGTEYERRQPLGDQSQADSHDSRSSIPSPPSFPLRLQRILDKHEADGQKDIISWLSHGRAFIVHDVDRFVAESMPLYFNQTKYSSFQRQLHMYHFQRITAGPDKGAYHHPCFLRGQPELCLGMTRTRVNGNGTRRPGNPDNEPHFYDLEPMPPIAQGSQIEIPREHPQQGHRKKREQQYEAEYDEEIGDGDYDNDEEMDSTDDESDPSNDSNDEEYLRLVC